MKRSREFVLLLLLFLSLLGVSFFFHEYFLKESTGIYGNKLTKSYLVSSTLLVIGFSFFFFLSQKVKDRLGFIFLFWVIAKFMLTYKLLFADFKSDGAVSKTELLVIILPYLIALFGLTFYVARLLNKP